MKKKKTPQIVTLLVLTLIVVVFWIFFSVYRVFANKPSPIVPPEVIVPLDAKLDSDTLEEIKTKTFITP